MNCFSLFAVLLIVTQAPGPVPRQAPNGAAHAYSKPEDKTYKGNPPPPPALAVAIPKKDDNPDLKANGDEGTNARSPQVDVDVVKMPRRERFDWITWGGGILLTIVGIGGVIVAVCTLKKIERQTKATEDSIRLQEIAYYQWVELANWRSDFMPQTGERTYRVRVDLANPTDFPVTINEASITFGEGNTFTYSPGDNLFLTPDIPHIVEVFIVLTQDQLGRWARNLLILKVSGKITYTGVLKKRQTQSIRGSLLCGISVMKFESEFPMGPDVHEQNKETQT
jgi:hypothetical protein